MGGRAVALYHGRKADRVVAEVNQGGDMVEAVLREVDADGAVPRGACAARQTARAEPVAALYEQGRVSHVGAFPELEDEMCTRIGDGGQPGPARCAGLGGERADAAPAARAAGAGAVRR